MSNLGNTVWFDMMARNQIEARRDHLRGQGYDVDNYSKRTRLKKMRVSVMLTLLFGAIGLVYVSVRFALLMMFVNTTLFVVTFLSIYFFGGAGILGATLYLTKMLTIGMAVHFTNKHNEKVAAEEKERRQARSEVVTA